MLRITDEPNIIRSQYPKGNILMWDVYHHSDKHCPLYSCPLILLHDNETLTTGRFKNFSMQQFENKIKISMRHPGITAVSNLPPRKNLFEETTKYVELISKNIKGKWSVEFEFYSADNGDIIFSFEQKSDAMFFKLIWG